MCGKCQAGDGIGEKAHQAGVAMSIELDQVIQDFATCLKRVDAKRPQALNARSKEPFQPGIGPHSEAEVVAMVADDMAQFAPSLYKGKLITNVPYPESPRQKCDLCILSGPMNEWAIEVKMLRFLGDNGKVNDNILMHILSPYPNHRSAVTDCEKLATSSIALKKSIMIYGFDHDEWPLAPAIEAFESLACLRTRIGVRIVAEFNGLIHPIHDRGKVYAWQVEGKVA